MGCMVHDGRQGTIIKVLLRLVRYTRRSSRYCYGLYGTRRSSRYHYQGNIMGCMVHDGRQGTVMALYGTRRSSRYYLLIRYGMAYSVLVWYTMVVKVFFWLVCYTMVVKVQSSRYNTYEGHDGRQGTIIKVLLWHTRYTKVLVLLEREHDNRQGIASMY
jgi:hypothetical protein